VALKTLQYVATFIAAVLSGSLKLDPRAHTENQPWLATSIDFLQTLVPTLLPWAVFGLIISKLGRELIGSPWKNAAVADTIEQMRIVAFPKRGGGIHLHRATLFKADGWFKWTRRLVIYARSGHTTQGSTTNFKIPPDVPDRAQGIAGITWKVNAVVVKKGLPHIDAGSDEATKAEYARETGVSVAWLNGRTYNARSFMGIPIEVNGALWGVVVLDSADERAIRTKYAIECLARHLSCLLSRTKS